MDFRLVRDSAILIAATALTRFAFRSHFLYDIDSVNFALALRRFDPVVHQPHPPGYFLYVRLGMLSNSIFHDANTALVAISILASCATVVLIHRLACDWFGRSAGQFAGLLFVCSPLAWFHGTVALTYIVEAFFSALIGYFCWRVYGGAGRFIVPAAAALGLASGFRQSSLLVLAPLFLFSFRRAPRRLALCGVSALGLVLMTWFIPMLYASGGMSAYASSLWALWRLVPARQTVFTSSVFTSLVRLFLIVWIYALCFGCAALLPLLAVFAAKPGRTNGRIKTFTWMWLSPGLILFTFVYLKFVNSGYLLVLLPPACAWLGWWAAGWYNGSSLSVVTKVVLLGAAAAVNCAIFLRAPLYFSYREVQRSQLELMSAVASVRRIARPQETVIVGFDSHFLGYRHAGYYLPEYLIVQFPEVPLASTTGVFAMQHSDTRLVSRLPVGTFRDFILFPLPSSDSEYREYMQRIRARFPAGELRVITQNGSELLTGPISALHLLFPNAIAP
jgi:4-amino-4-deoxy-L-arabinose transferase-like glycosyltransferase